ncbi:L-histidine N(alpha)-methyltransferase, partial [Microcoleus sp. PH2017_14_LAR_D_A]|uniref:L-histidine N(alpha)-methyltransferase n=1 Tax=Microcoleus sp. PH2017_14_LAR_D_A TaxID=2798825 RepID=UPI0025D3BF5F
MNRSSIPVFGGLILIPSQDRLHYYPIDVSAGILKSTALALLERYPNLKLCGLAGTYEQALAQLPPAELGNRMVIFLGSTLGNLTDRERSSFLTQIQQALQPGEFFLLGVRNCNLIYEQSYPSLTIWVALSATRAIARDYLPLVQFVFAPV